nr:hypothetical protein [Akkermansiaceae bacterium]
MGVAPVSDVCHVESLRSLHRKHIPGIIKILGSAPTDFLDDEILGSGKPSFDSQFRSGLLVPAIELLLYERIIKKLKQFDYQSRVSSGLSNVPATPGDGVELDLVSELNLRLEAGNELVDAFGPINLLIPMLAHASEIRQTLALIDKARAQLDARAQVHGMVRIGAMIEVPAAALTIPLFLRHF